MTEGMKGRGFSYEKDSKRLSFSSFFLVATDGLKDAAGFPKRWGTDTFFCGGTWLDAAFRTSTSTPIKYSRDASGILSVEGLNHNWIIGSSKTERLA